MVEKRATKGQFDHYGFLARKHCLSVTKEVSGIILGSSHAKIIRGAQRDPGKNVMSRLKRKEFVLA